MTKDVKTDSDIIFPSSMPLSMIGKAEEEVTSTASTADYRQVSATSLTSSAISSDLIVDEPVVVESVDAAPEAETEIEETAVETGPDNETRDAVASLESAFTREDPKASTRIKVTPSPPKEAPPASVIESSKIDRFEEVVAENSAVGDEREEMLQPSFKVTPSPPKEAPPASVIESHAEEDKVLLSKKSQTPFSFTLGEEFRMIKQQDDLAIAKNALTHFTKAAVGGGVATLLTLGSIFKAATSPDVASSAKAVSSTVFEATEASDDKSVARVAKNIGSVVVSIGAVGSAFLRSFQLAAVSSDAAEAGTDATKEFTLLLASLVALSLKQGDRLQDTLSQNLVENNTGGKVKSEGLAEALESIMAVGVKQGERALESLAHLKADIAAATAGIAKEMKQNLRFDITVASKTIPEDQVLCTNTPIEKIERNAHVNGFAFDAKVEIPEQEMMMPFKEATPVNPPSDDDTSNIEESNEVPVQSADVNGFALEMQAEIGDSTTEEEDLKFLTENIIGSEEEDTLNSPMTNDTAKLPEEESYFFATYD